MRFLVILVFIFMALALKNKEGRYCAMIIAAVASLEYLIDIFFELPMNRQCVIAIGLDWLAAMLILSSSFKHKIIIACLYVTSITLTFILALSITFYQYTSLIYTMMFLAALTLISGDVRGGKRRLLGFGNSYFSGK